MIQISMDGPNVNCDVLSLHSSYREKNEFSRLISMGSCGFHVLHGAMQTGIMETDWEVSKVLHVMCKIFDESPKGEIFISGKLVVIFFLCIFARPGRLKMNPLLHVVFRYGKILSKSSNTGIHCQKINTLAITHHLIPWSSTT